MEHYTALNTKHYSLYVVSGAGPRPGSVFTSSHYTPQPDYTRLQARCCPGDLGLAASQTISIGVRGAPVPVCIMRARPFNPNPNISLEVSNFAA